jgi:predicted DNA-binding protein
MKSKSRYVGIRIPSELAERLAVATDKARNPYAPTQSQIVVRGIELALAEMASQGPRRPKAK